MKNHIPLLILWAIAWQSYATNSTPPEKPSILPNGCELIEALELASMTNRSLSAYWFLDIDTVMSELLEFKAVEIKEGVEISWITRGEEIDIGYELLASYDQKEFKSIYQVNGKEGKEEQKQYVYLDKQVKNEKEKVKRASYQLIQLGAEDSYTPIGQTSLALSASGPDPIANLLPQVTPKSPTVAAMERFGQYPVSYYTGQPRIEIPITTIRAGDLEIPIRLAYHGGGHKVSDVAPRQGLGWSITGLYDISRQIRGQPDETSSTGMLNQQLPTYNLGCVTLADKEALNQHLNFGKDLERDIFTYSTPLRSNSFVVTPDSTYFLEADRSLMSYNGGFNDFTLLDDHGNQYKYTVRESTTSNNIPASTTAWHVREILTSKAGDQIRYNYHPAETFSYETDRTYTHIYHANVCGNYSGIVTAGWQTPFYTQNVVTITAREIKEIFYPGGKIVFVQGDNREDLTGAKELDKIELYDYNFNLNAGAGGYTLIRTFDLSFVYKERSNSSGAKVLFLDQVHQKDGTGATIGTYKLTYNSTALPAIHSLSVDKHGYYNGASNTSLIPAYSIPYSKFCLPNTDTTATNSSPANRNSSSTYMDAWMLKRMDYPAGGYTTFTYEPHRYHNGSTSVIVGGLRINKMVDYSGSGSLSHSFRYGANESGYGTYRDQAKDILRTDQIIDKEDNTGGSDFYSYKIMSLSAGVNTILNPFEGVAVTYPVVTEYLDSTGVGSVGRIVYTFKDDLSDLVLLGNTATNRQVLQSRHWGRGQLLNKKVFGSSGLIKEEETNTYQSIIASNPTPALGYIIGRTLLALTQGTPDGQGCLQDDDQYILTPYSWYPGLLRQSGSTTKTYDDTNQNLSVSKTVQTDYHATWYQPTEIRSINTDGDTRIQRFRYVTDLSNLSSSHSGAAAAFYRMRVNNQINIPVEKVWIRRVGTTDNYLAANLTLYTTKTVGTRIYVLPDDVFQAQLDPLFTSTSFTPVNVTGAGAITQSSTYLHRLELQTYSSFGKLTHWRRPGNSTTAYTWHTRLDSVYHHRLTHQVLNNGSSAAQTTQYRTRMPLLGLDTLIAPNGLQNRFEYDAYGRLKRSRDNANHILSEYDYIISATGNSRILQYTPRTAAGTLSSNPLQVMTNVSFYDGLGRLQQVLGVQATPGATKHLVTGAVIYDNFGRTHRQYVSFDASGGYTTKATPPGTMHADSKPYSEVKMYDNSPLHRPKQRLGPGNMWHSNNKYIEDRYLVAPGNTIRRYTNIVSGANVTGTYPANTLLMHQTISEQGNVMIEYLDNDGKVVQKSEQDSTGTYRHTAYIYDNLDRLRFVIQPEGFETATSFTIDDAYFLKWVYENVYDKLGRVIWVHVPGAGRSYIVYDRLDQTVMTQSALQRTLNKWSFIHYDAFGREAYAGEVTYTAIQATLAGLFAGISQCYETWSGGVWSKVSFPTVVNNAPTVIKTEHIYDSNIPWSSLAPFNTSHAYHSKIDDVKGLRTGTFSYDSDDPAQSYFDVVYYDYKGRVIQTIRSHHLSANPASPKKIVTSLEYNHIGDVLRTKTTWSIEGMADLTHIDSTAYDHRSRPLFYANGINGPATAVCSYGYDVVGRLTIKTYRPGESFTKGGIHDYIYRPPSPNQFNTADTARLAIVLDAGTEIHVDTSPVNTYMAVIDTSAPNGTTINALQTVQFKYNIRDWLTGINLNGSGNPIPNTTEGDLFSLKLDYESGGRYDGTLVKQTWTLPAEGQTPQQQRSYQYTYDSASRIKTAIYAGVNGENYTVSGLLYDKNGNIRKLKRNGLKGTGYGQIDDLTYTLDGNRLTRVEDAEPGDHQVDFVNRASQANEYEYYADGCLKKDLNENISLITYDTYLKLPVLITLSTGDWIRYIYDGHGSLIRRQLSDGTIWDYLGGMILKHGVPYQIAMAEGRVIYEEGVWHNEYEYRDNVGNLRVAFTERNGRLQKTHGSDYTPFGLPINQQIYTPAPCKFTFHGHEDQGDFGLRLTSMGARCYNQTIGRFMANDALSMQAPSWTGYRLGWNQPMNVNDPTGNMEISDGYGTISGASAVDYSGPLDDYRLNQDGTVELIEETDDDFDRLIATDASGNQTDKSIKVEKGILGSLNQNDGKLKSNTLWGEKSGTYANTKSRADAFNVFKFASDNSDVEWGLIGSKDGQNTLGTLYDNSSIGGLLKVSGFELNDLSFDYHSHPGGPSKTGDFASGMMGDQGFASSQISRLLKLGASYDQLPRYYIYRPHVDKPYRFEYSPWNNKFNVNRVYSWKNL